jgi:hypothetical protein
MLDPESRYAEVAQTKRRLPDGREVAYLQRRFLPQAEALAMLVEVEVRQDERLDLIGARTLGEATQWWRIADANEALHPDELEEVAGRRLRVPVPEVDLR